MNKTHDIYSRILITGICAMICCLSPMRASGLDLSTYAGNSRLASGHWVKISVPESGLYMISNSTLRQWGFSDPSRVRIYGYGGKRIGDILNTANYIDDLPMTQSETTSQGIVFYGVGPDSWEQSPTRGQIRYHKEFNIYTNAGYYFLTESDEEAPEIKTQGKPSADDPKDTFYDRLHHEQELESPGESGHLLVGENFRYQPRHTFTFETPDCVDGQNTWMECSFVALTYGSSSLISFTADGEKVSEDSNDRISPTSNSSYYHGMETVTRHYIAHSGDKLEITIDYSASTTIHGAWLNYLAINYPRYLKLNEDGYLNFWHSDPQLKLSVPSSAKDLRVWDVTNPRNITSINISGIDGDGCAEWTNDFSGQRSYVAWSETARIPSPVYEGEVVNQNLHATPCTEMIIFTLPEFASQAQRIADMHRSSERPVEAIVVDVNEVYNEFASGSADISALRKFMKMLWDRGNAEGKPLRFALLFGRTTYDNRHLTEAVKALGHATIPCWLGGTNRSQLNDNDGFGTDDFIAMLSDGSGNNMGLDPLEVAVGRMPVRTLAEAKNAVDKLCQYVEQSKKTSWKNHFMLLADDEDAGIHMTQTEAMYKNMMEAPGQQHFFTKVYLDAYDKSGGNYPEARNTMFRLLDEGIVWWSFVGHANNHSWTKDGQLTYDDINNMYLSHVPILYAATCDFLRWDSNTLSGGEILFHERYGGTIATISATRPVYISDNGYFSRAIGKYATSRDDDGYLLPLGEIYRLAKNNILNDKNEHKSNTNRLRFVLMGDPAMQLATPHNRILLETIGGKNVDLEDQITISALQNVTITGSVTDVNGEKLTDFDGVANITLYDAEQSITTKGNGDGKKVTFEQHGDKLFAGSAPVTNGEFSIKIAMPGEIADNFRPATMNMYAYATNSNAEASGVNRDFYVYGFDENAPEDNIAPKIESLVLNHASFKNGDQVNGQPMVIACVSDDTGINISSAGIGHQMTITLDGTRTYTDVSSYYTPSADGSPSGSINYPMDGLTAGNHTLALKIWDTTGNSASSEIEFYVKEGLAPVIYDIYTTANPASEQTDFYIVHDRPDAMVSVTITVYNLLGHALWSETTSGRSDMSLSSPVTWDLCDSSGRRVQRGIYLYRATITTDGGETFDTATRKIAVTAP